MSRTGVMLLCIALIIGAILVYSYEHARHIKPVVVTAPEPPKDITTSYSRGSGISAYANPPDLAFTKTLTVHKYVVLRGVELCKSHAMHYNFSPTYTCKNGECETLLDYGLTPVPMNAVISRKYQGNCIQQTIPNLPQYLRVYNYASGITIDDALAAKMGFGNLRITRIDKTPKSRFFSATEQFLPGETLINLLYAPGAPPLEDELMIGSKTIDIHYIIPDPRSPSPPKGQSQTQPGAHSPQRQTARRRNAGTAP